MNPSHADFVMSYANLSEPELVELARSYDTLKGEAQVALREEFARRGLEPPLVEEVESREPPAQRNLVTIRRYRDLSEAIVARSMLESAGIGVYLRDENLVRLDWQVSNFIGGIRLQVDAADEPNALELLSQPVQDSIPYGEGDEFTQPHCPSCGSTDITFEGASRGAALASLYILSVPLPFGHETWLCGACGARWEDTKD
jgi:Putative prokaryotic signal transducing protein